MSVDLHPSPWWHTDVDLHSQDESIEGPENLTVHMIYHDAEDCTFWGIVPGTGLCGFVFTTADDVGPAEMLRNHPDFVLKDCQRCIDIAAEHRAFIDMWNRLDGD